MKTNKTSISLIIIGIILIAFAEFNYTDVKNSFSGKGYTNTQPVEEPFKWSPVIGLVLLIGGIVAIYPDKNFRV